MDNEALFRAVREWVAANYPQSAVLELSLRLTGVDRCVRLPVPACGCPAAPPRAANPPAAEPNLNETDLHVLRALEGRAFRTGGLEAETGLDHSLMFRSLKKLRELNPPLVGHHHRLGYYRPDCPPPELSPPG